jgi:DNA-binding ferritin-like protein (Dps family)
MIKTSSLIKQLNKSAKNLSLENKKIFDDIILYIRMSNIKTRDAEEFLQQLLDSFLNAQQQGVSIETMLGTPDIKKYCEEIISTYKSSYNYLSRYSEYIMFTGMLITIFCIINYIIQNFSIITKGQVDNFTLYLNFDLGLIFQLLLTGPLFIAIFAYFRRNCFKESKKHDKIKEFFMLYGLNILLICTMVAFFMFVDNVILFRLNIIIVLIIGIALYFIGSYLSEK